MSFKDRLNELLSVAASHTRGSYTALSGEQRTTEVSKKAQAKADTPTTTKKEVKLHTDITSQIGDDGAIAIVDNSDDRGNHAWATDYGYVHTKIPELEDGAVVFLDNKGNYTYYSDDEMSEDYKAQVDKFKLAHQQARDEYAQYEQIQSDAAEYAAQQDDPTSLLDVICSPLAAYNKFREAYVTRDVEGMQAATREGADAMWDSVKDWAWKYHKYSLIGNDKVEYYQQMYSDGDPLDAIKKLHADETLSERDKQYMSYMMVAGSNANMAGEIVMDTLKDMGESMDWLANPVKATVIWLSYQNSDTSPYDVQGKYKDYLQTHGYSDVLSACYSLSYTNQKRMAFNYDTGDIKLDFVLEVFADPEAWLSIGKAVADANTARAVVEALGEDAKQIPKNKLWTAVQSTDALEALIKEFPEDAQIGVRQVLSDALEYSKAYKISKSLGTLKDAKQLVDDFMLWGTGIKPFGKAFKAMYKGAVEAFNTVGTGLRECLSLKAWNDAVSEVAGKVENPFTINTADEVICYAERNIAALKSVEPEAVAHLTPQEKLDFVTAVYINERHMIEQADVVDAEVIIDLNKRTAELLEMHDMTDTPIYRYVTDSVDNSVMEVIPYVAPEWATDAAIRLDELGDVVRHDLQDLAGKPQDMSGKLYTVKYGSELVADSIMTAKGYMTAVHNPQSLNLDLLDSAKYTADARFTTELLATRTSVLNYEYITDALGNSQKFTPNMQKALRDYLFNAGLQRRVRGTFSAGLAGLDNASIRAKLGSISKAWVDGAFNLEAKYTEAFASTYEGLQCCTLDLPQNLRNIREQFELLDAYHNITPCFYSYKLDVNGSLKELIIAYGDDALHMRVNNGRIPTAELEHKILEFMEDARKTNKRLRMVGFNGHGTGFDADRAIIDCLSQNRATHVATVFKSTIDVADELRIRQGLPVPTQDMYTEAYNIMQQCGMNWRYDEIMFGLTRNWKNHFGLTPPDDLWINKLTDLEVQDPALRQISNELSAKATDIQAAYQVLHSNGKLLVTEADFMRELRRTYGHEVALHQVWDGQMMSRFNPHWQEQFAGLDRFSYDRMFEFIRDAEHYRKALRPGYADLLKDYIDTAFEGIKSILKSEVSQRKFVETYDIDAATVFLEASDDIPTDSKLALLLKFTQDNVDDEWWFRGGDINGGILMKGIADADRPAQYQKYFRTFKVINEEVATPTGTQLVGHQRSIFAELMHPYEHLLTTPKVKYHIDDELIPGSFGVPQNYWNRISETIGELNAINEGTDSLLEMQKYLDANGMNKALAQYETVLLEKFKEPYTVIKGLYEEAAEDTRASIRRRFSAPAIGSFEDDDMFLQAEAAYARKYAYDMTSAEAKFITQDTATGLYDRLNDIVFEWSKKRLDSRAVWITNLTNEQFDWFLWHDCNGRLVVNMNDISVLARGKMRATLDKFGYTYEEADGFLKVIGHESPEVELPRMELNVEAITRDRIQHSGGHMTAEAREQLYQYANAINRIENLCADYSHSSITYGSFIPNNRHLQDAIDAKFFGGVELPEFHNYDGYMCGYLGEISELREFDAIVSNNALVNIMNATTLTARNNIQTGDMLQLVFGDGKFKAAQELEHLKAYGITESDLYDNGYRIVELQIPKTEQGFRPILVERTSLAKASDQVAIMTYDDFDALNKRLKACKPLNISAEVERSKPKILKWLRGAQSAYISSYLFTNPSTWVRNFVDSTTKGFLSEGGAHFRYMFEAEHLNRYWEDVYEQIVKDYEKINLDIVDEWFKKNPDAPISAIRFKQMWSFQLSSVRDGKIETVWNILHDTRTEDAIKGNNALDRFLIDNKWYQFNASKFEWVENTNRLAIYLKATDEGATRSAALQRVAKSQFDYSKTKRVGTLNVFVPFISFTMKNYEYWFGDGVSDSMRWFEADLIDLFRATQDADTEFWSEDAQRYRAYISSVAHSMQQEYGSDSTEHHYNMFEDYNGTADSVARDSGWIMLNDRLYFKSGLSLIDAINLSYTTVEDLYGEIFAPLTNLIPARLEDGKVVPLSKAQEGIYKLCTAVGSGELSFEEWVTEYGFDTFNTLPLIGTVSYRIMQTIRNAMAMQRDDEISPLTVVSPTLFAVGQDDDRYTATLKQSYLLREIGVDWYDTDHTDKRYIMGMSYVNAWVAKDPASYINTYGRLQQLGLSADDVGKLMDDGGALWFTKNNEGEYQIQNHLLQVGDDETYNKLYDDLIGMGWSPADAIRLLTQASERVGYKSTLSDTERVYGHSDASQGYKRLGSASSALSVYSPRTPYRSISAMSKGKYQQPRGYMQKAQTPKPTMTYYRWHKRDSDIYHDLYAQYGASRIAMRQNPRAYSNRSITEMYRTNQTQRYARIHRRHGWY